MNLLIDLNIVDQNLEEGEGSYNESLKLGGILHLGSLHLVFKSEVLAPTP